jgi:hypothetical protein
MDMTSLQNILLGMSVGLFLLGCVTFATGVIILVTRSLSRDVNTIANQTTQLVQKGLAEDVAGLVGNASALLNTTSEMVRTAAGIGVFFTILGLVMMGISIGLVLYIYMG